MAFERPLRVVIGGGGIAGNVLLRQLRPYVRSGRVVVRLFEKRGSAVRPPGLNILLNHNGMAALRETDPELEGNMRAVGRDVVNWTSRLMSGETLFDLDDVVREELAQVPCLVARWDRIHKACEDGNQEYIEYDKSIDKVEFVKNKLRVTLSSNESIDDIDLVVGCDGRYSKVRDSLLGVAETYYGPPYIADFRIVCSAHEFESIPDFKGIQRVYQKVSNGCVRAGLMRMPPKVGGQENDELGLFGNVPISDLASFEKEKADPHFLARAFSSSHETYDDIGTLVLKMLQLHGAEARWARKQETATAYTAAEGNVLLIGDAAGAIYPSLGQGANLSLEDACIAAAAFRAYFENPTTPNAITHRVAAIRTPRRNDIQRWSRQHAMHVATGDLHTEIKDWTVQDGPWRKALFQLWNGWPRAYIAQHFEPFKSQVATRENFAPFGDLVTVSQDGDLYNPETIDAALDLSRGTPRLYFMELKGPRPFQVRWLTRHTQVSQCLASLDNRPFWLAVHEPTAESHQPMLSTTQVFLIPPRHFVKLHSGTWHAGPYWRPLQEAASVEDDKMTFVNLELADTNVVDHYSVDLLKEYNINDPDAAIAIAIPTTNSD